MKQLAIALMIITCSYVSLAARRSTNPPPPAENAWQQQLSWQKLQKNMSPDQVQQILGPSADHKKGASVMIWYYQKGDTENAVIRFKGIDSVYYVFDWVEPDYAAVRRQIQAKLQAEQAILRGEEAAKAAEAKAAAEAEEKFKQAQLEEKRLAAELRQANIEKARLAKKLEIERLNKRRQELIARKRELNQQGQSPAPQVQQVRSPAPKETPKKEMVGGIGANILIFGGIAFLVLVFSYVFFFRKTYQ